MTKLKRSEIRAIDRMFGMEGGYVLDFSNRTFSEFFEDEFGIDIYAPKYAINGSSKAKHLRTFIELESGHLVARVLRKLWELKTEDIEHLSPVDPDFAKEIKKIEEIVAKIETDQPIAAVPALTETAKTLDLDTVSRDLDRALASVKDDPEDAVTAACSTVESVCRSILIELGQPLPKKKDIRGLYNAVRSPLGLSPDRSDVDPQIAEDVRNILGGLATVVQGVGALRTHGGDAHGRERGYKRIDHRIASLSIHAASTVAIFLIETWQTKFPSRELPEHKDD